MEKRFFCLRILLCFVLFSSSSVFADTTVIDGCTTNAEEYIATVTTASIENRNDRIRLSKNVYVVYTPFGEVCYQSAPRIKEGDKVKIGIYGTLFDLANLRTSVLSCNLQNSDLNIFDTVNFTGSSTLGAASPPSQTKYGTQWMSELECYGNNFEFEVRQEKELRFRKTVKQYVRYRGTWQLGTAITSLGERSYRLETEGTQNIVRANQSGGRGPLYVGSLVVYGLPHYLQGLGNRQLYAGRDIVNEHNWKDSLGLVFSIGLNEPEDTWGIGLSYEIARGINITGSQLYRNITVLDGIAAGEAYAGSNVPVVNKWKSQFVFGISIDGRYLAKFFSP